jgi:hypothetical protein
VAAVDEVTLAELADETVLTSFTADAIDRAANGEAVLHVPQSIARAESRRDLVYRPITDAPVTTIGVAWLAGDSRELIEDFIGVVRGRTANSSRTAQARADKGKPPAPKPAARKEGRDATRTTRYPRRPRG